MHESDTSDSFDSDEEEKQDIIFDWYVTDFIIRMRVLVSIIVLSAAVVKVDLHFRIKFN